VGEGPQRGLREREGRQEGQGRSDERTVVVGTQPSESGRDQTSLPTV